MTAITTTSGTSEALLTRFRAKEIALVSLISSILLNVLLFTRVYIIETDQFWAADSGFDNFFSKVSVASNPVDNESKKKLKSSLLQCQPFGGPSDEAAAEMVYWRRDIPEKKQFHSVYDDDASEKYFVYEPDEAGFSNVRMSFETVVALAKATGRTLVLTPTMRFAQLMHPHPEGIRSYSYRNFFDISGIPYISMEEYIHRVALTGQLQSNNGEISFPPNNRSNWDGRLGNTGNSDEGESGLFFQWLSDSAKTITWKSDSCVIAFPSAKEGNIENIRAEVAAIFQSDNGREPWERSGEYYGRPIPVNSSMPHRLREMIAHRKELCEYDKDYQEAKSLYMTGHESTGSRPLIPFFAYLFFETSEQDVQMKRFIRDHVRFSDVIQCASARIVEEIREIARKTGNGSNKNGSFDTMHVRREDFKWVDGYKEGLVDADKMLEDEFIETQRTVYIATDEQDKSFFAPFREHHTVLFLHDFDHLLEGIDPNYYGMIEQLVCARGEKFVGTFYSTFTGYINRVRGYHSQKKPIPLTLSGFLNSEYMGHEGRFRNITHSYASAQEPFWSREWPIAWRDIDFDVE